MPIAGPVTAATIGFCDVEIACRNWNTGRSSAKSVAALMKSAMSLPLVKIPGWPCSSTARTPASALAPRSASAIAAYIATVRAFLRSGRRISMRRTRSATCVTIDESMRLRSIGLYVQPALREQLRLQCVPVEPPRAADVAERVDDAALHAFQAADVNVAVIVLQHAHDLVGALADAILHVRLRLLRHAREREVDVDEVLRQLHQRPEVRQLAVDARAEEQQQVAALVERAAPAAPFRHGAHGRRAGARADHHQRRSRVIRHQEARAVRADDPHLIADRA